MTCPRPRSTRSSRRLLPQSRTSRSSRTRRLTTTVFINYMWEAANQAVLAMFRNYTIANRLALRGGTLDLQRNAGIPLGMVTQYVGGLPDINVLADPDDVPDRAPLLQVTQSRTEAENRTLDELWLRIQAA